MKEHRISDPRINDRIRVSEVRLVGPSGEQVGVVPIEVALRLSREADLDLVEVAPNSKPPVVKIMDYGKYKYEEAQKAKDARKNQANTVLKEVRFRLKIDKHDYETKRKRAIGFLGSGDKVKAMILFRGREQSRPEMGVRLLQRFAEEVAEFGSVESSPMIDGRNMVMIIGPLKNKAAAKAEAGARKVAATRAAADASAARAEAKAARLSGAANKPNPQSADAASSVIDATETKDSPQRSEVAADPREMKAPVAPMAAAAVPKAAAEPTPKAPAAPKAPLVVDKSAREAESPSSTTAKPAAKPVAKPVAKPAAKPATQPTAKPAAKPASKPAAKPPVEPAASSDKTPSPKKQEE